MLQSIEIRRADAADAQACGKVTFEAFRALAGRHGFPPDFPSVEAAEVMIAGLLSAPTVDGFVAELDGHVVGCVFVDLAAPVAGVGPIAVSPSLQAGGVGRRLMKAALGRAETAGLGGVRLAQAAYNNASLSLYASLGFRARAPLSAMQGSPPTFEIEGHHVRRAEEDDIAACGALARFVIGFDRDGDLRAAVEAKRAMVVEARGGIAGYTTGIGFGGHAVTEDDQGLKALICAAPSFPGPGFLLPTQNAAVLDWCLQHGLRIVMQMTYMSTGLYSEPNGGWLPSILR